MIEDPLENLKNISKVDIYSDYDIMLDPRNVVPRK